MFFHYSLPPTSSSLGCCVYSSTTTHCLHPPALSTVVTVLLLLLAASNRLLSPRSVSTQIIAILPFFIRRNIIKNEHRRRGLLLLFRVQKITVCSLRVLLVFCVVPVKFLGNKLDIWTRTFLLQTL
jgi:hypothetical protein